MLNWGLSIPAMIVWAGALAQVDAREVSPGAAPAFVDGVRAPIRIVRAAAAEDGEGRGASLARESALPTAAGLAAADNAPLPLAPPGRERRSEARDGSMPLRPANALSTAITGLAVVLGIFALLAWFTRKSGRRGAGSLPGAVVATLGRCPLNAHQEMQLVRVGRKLLLLSVTATGAEALTEIDDPEEIDRLTTLCGDGQGDSLAASFRDVLSHLPSRASAGATYPYLR